MAKILLAAKYTFFVAVVLSAGFAIEHLTGINRLTAPSRLVQDLNYDISSPLAFGNSEPFLDKYYLKCFTQPSKPFCILSADKRLDLFKEEQSGSTNIEVIENRMENITSRLRPFKRRMYSLLVDFTALMKTLGVSLLLIEPSMLFCVLSYPKKYSLLTSGFNPNQFQGSRNVVTFGVLHKDAEKLKQNNATYELLSAGFKIMKIKKSVKSWSWLKSNSEEFLETVHYFFIRDEIVVHIVVFYTRQTYLWHSGLNSADVDIEGLLFTNDEAFENFTVLPLNLDGTSLSQIFIPHDIRYFTKELESSTFVECKADSSKNMTSDRHPTLNAKELNHRAAIVLKELKTILAPEVVRFWLWGNSLSGWHDQCDIWHHSVILELALPFKSAKELNLTALLSDNKFLKVQNYSVVESDFEIPLDCHGLKINIFIIYEDHDTFWYRRTEEEHIYKIVHPLFTICSTDIFGLKVNIPCDFDSTNSGVKENWTDNTSGNTSTFISLNESESSENF